jgi:hypothetical protein
LDYESTLRVHLVPYFGDVALSSITAPQIERYLTVKLRGGRAPNSIRNDLGLLHGVLALGEKRGWVLSNPRASSRVGSPRGWRPARSG